MLGVKYPKDGTINHKVIPAYDIPTYKMTPHFDEANQFIKSALARGNILVHCAAGISRVMVRVDFSQRHVSLCTWWQKKDSLSNRPSALWRLGGPLWTLTTDFRRNSPNMTRYSRRIQMISRRRSPICHLIRRKWSSKKMKKRKISGWLLEHSTITAISRILATIWNLQANLLLFELPVLWKTPSRTNPKEVAP